MVKTTVPKSLAEQIADLDDPTPKDFDPEDIEGAFGAKDGSSSGSGDEDDGAGREHYVDVGKIKLRKPQQPALGPRYKGSRVRREELGAGDESDDDPFGSGASQHDEVGASGGEEEGDGNGAEEEGVVDPDDIDVDMDALQDGEDEDIDSDEAFGEGDEEKFEGFTFRGSRSGGQRVSSERAPKKAGKGKKKKRQDKESASDEDMDMDMDMNGATDSEDDDLGSGTGASETDSDNEDAMSLDGSNSDSDDSSSTSDSASESDLSSQPPEENDTDRATLRKMMAEEQKTVLATISSAQNSDIAKGRAVQHQRRTFDALLNTRIRLQKALGAMNSLSALPPSSIPPNAETSINGPPATNSGADTRPTNPPDLANDAAILAAETAALNLFNTLSSLRQSLPSHHSASIPTTVTPSTPTSIIHTHLSTLDASARSNHRATLTKWAQKTHLVSSLPSSNRFSAAAATQPLTNVLDSHLQAGNLDRLVARTRVVRAAGAVQAQTGGKEKAAAAEDVNVYDDADFYTLLLRELVDQKMANSSISSGPNPSAAVGPGGGGIDVRGLKREAKTRKNVDTKASKGRKMRYTVHEKLQNFMAREERGTWGERQVGELFGGLLRQKRAVLEEDAVISENESDEGSAAEEGLRLFGGEN
ncbi:rRNA-processing protein bfr2 [Trapelia coarctata]|nr:rRNA-processing protein bfr2 [Trapelia coarctata]